MIPALPDAFSEELRRDEYNVLHASVCYNYRSLSLLLLT